MNIQHSEKGKIYYSPHDSRVIIALTKLNFIIKS